MSKPPKGSLGFTFTHHEPSPSPTVPMNLDSKTTITVDGKQYHVDGSELENIETLGRGQYGVVEKVRHKESGIVMAVKLIRCTMNIKEQKRLNMDLEINMKTRDCPYTVDYYGALFREGDVGICMEVMDTSLDRFYKMVYNQGTTIPEEVLGKIAVSVVKALHYLQQELQVMHRDVKPSNILINRGGEVKICDFGISGDLINSLANTVDAGCKPYMAPERIDPAPDKQGYDVRSDVWSLGITMIEIATGKFPYNNWKTPFDQLKQVVKEKSPRLPITSPYSPELQDFINQCLVKNYINRPKYINLLEHTFIVESDKREVDMSSFVCGVLDKTSEGEVEAN